MQQEHKPQPNRNNKQQMARHMCTLPPFSPKSRSTSQTRKKPVLQNHISDTIRVPTVYQNCAGYSSHSEAEKPVTGLKELRLGKKGKGPGLVLEYSFYYGMCTRSRHLTPAIDRPDWFFTNPEPGAKNTHDASCYKNINC